MRAGLLALALLAAPQAGRADPAAACLDAGGDLAATLAALEAEGWAPVDLAAPLPEPVAASALWPFAAVYLAADTGGASLAEIMAMQRRAVEGLARKRDLPGARTRLLARDAPAGVETVLLTVVQVLPGMAELSCRFALADPAAAAPVGTPDGVEVSRARFEAVGTGGFRSVQATALDPEAIALRLGAPVPVTLVVETTLRYPSEAPR